MRIRRSVRRPSKEITNVFCSSCQRVCDVEQVEIQAEMPTFTLTCGHEVILWPGAMCRLSVQTDAIILYPHQNDLPVQPGVI